MEIHLSGRAGRRIAAGATSVGLLIALAACGGGSGVASSTPAASPTTDAAKAQAATFCAANVAVEAAAVGGPPVDFETATPEQIQAALKQFGAMLEPLFVRLEQSSPAAARQDVATLTRLSRQALASGDETVFVSPEYVAAEAGLDRYLLVECGWDEVRMTATDHRYGGAPTTLPAGTTAFTLTNEGKEIHELSVARINDGVTQTLDQLLALPEAQAQQMVTLVGEAYAQPGAAATAFATLTPGRYVMICLIPEGSVPPAQGTGEPHAVLGQKAEFTVA